VKGLAIGALCPLALAIAVAALGISKASFVAGDSDAFGYVSEADLIAHGSLSIDQQFVRTMPWPFADWSFSPAGYRPATVRGVIVPTYPAGVPLIMALFQRVAGPIAVFYVVPLLGAIGVWATAALGTAVHRRLTGMVAALLLATSPIFLVELMAPASDVGATAWWTIALVCAVLNGMTAAVAAGLAASMAILTRPNLVPLAGVLGLFYVSQAVRAARDRRHRLLRLALFAVATIPGCLGVAAIHTHLYGSPLRSGYEALDALYAFANSGPNLDRFPRWLVQAHTPFVALASATPWFARTRRHPARAVDGGHVWLLLSFAAVVGASYLFYRPFGRDEWTYLRFLLPALPGLLVLAVAAALEISGRLLHARAVAAICALAVCALVGSWQIREDVRRHVFGARVTERRYIDVSRYIATTLPPNSLFIARLHAGSIRYYARRLTMYYDLLERRWLDGAVQELTERGYHPFIVVEEEEEPQFRERFGQLNALGRLDWPPAAERIQPVRVRIYDPEDRARFQRGERVETRLIESSRATR